MKLFHRMTRPIAAMLVACIWGLCAYIPTVQADMVSTEMLMQMEQANHERERLNALLERADVRAALAAQGVDAQQVESRVAYLTDEEVHALATQFDQLPAGAGALELILVVFLVLIITDLIGLTDIFTFIKKRR